MLDAGTRTVEEAQAERKARVGWPHPSPAATIRAMKEAK